MDRLVNRTPTALSKFIAPFFVTDKTALGTDFYDPKKGAMNFDRALQRWRRSIAYLHPSGNMHMDYEEGKDGLAFNRSFVIESGSN